MTSSPRAGDPGVLACCDDAAASPHHFCRGCLQDYVAAALKPNDGRGGLGGECLALVRNADGR